MAFIQNYLGTIVVALILVALITLVLVKYFKDKKAGKSSCGGGCQGCPNSEFCHKKR